MLFQDITLWVLWLFIFATPFELRLSVGGISLPGLMGYLSIGTGLLGVAWSKKLVKPSVGYVLLVAYCLWSTISIAWSDYPELSVSKALIYWGLLGFVALLTQYASSGNARVRLLGAYVFGCWGGVVSLIVSYITGTQYLGRYSSGFGDPNFLALALAIGIPIAGYLASHEEVRWRKILFVAYVPAAIASVIMTASRGGALATAAACLVYGAFHIHKIHRIRLVWIAGAFAVLFAMIYALPQDVMTRLETIPDQLQGGDLDGRRAYWDAAMGLIAKHPIRGVAAGAGDGNLTGLIGTERVFHNTPLEVATDGGMVGVALFYGALGWGLLSLWGSNSDERTYLFAACAAWFVGSASLSWEWHKVTWFVFGLVVSAVPQARVVRSRIVPVTNGRYRSSRVPSDAEVKIPVGSGARNVWD